MMRYFDKQQGAEAPTAPALSATLARIDCAKPLAASADHGRRRYRSLTHLMSDRRQMR
jgi:hypothetical protein